MAQVQDFFDEPTKDSSVPAQDAAYEAWFRRKVEAGLQDAREGRDISDEEMEAEAEALCEQLISKSSML